MSMYNSSFLNDIVQNVGNCRYEGWNRGQQTSTDENYQNAKINWLQILLSHETRRKQSTMLGVIGNCQEAKSITELEGGECWKQGKHGN